MPNDTNISPLVEAISFAARAHAGQTRKDGRTPYFAHPMRVLTVLQQVFGVTDLDTLTAAALHDVIEDTTTDFDDLEQSFGRRVAEYVALLSKDSRLREEDRETEYRAALAAAPVEVKLCKLGDVYDNLSDCDRISPEFRQHTARKMESYLAAIEQGFPATWRHALEAVRKQLEAVCR